MSENDIGTEDEEITITAGRLYRACRIESETKTKPSSTEKEDRNMWLSFSSTEPVERFFGIEILDHAPSSIEMNWLNSGRAPLLLDHDETKQIGVVEQAEIIGRRARAKIRFANNALANEAYRDVIDGIKANVSVGYRYMQDGVVLEDEGKKNKPNIYRITGWEPLEISLVSIPADHSVGIGRAGSKEYSYRVRRLLNKQSKQNIEENIMSKDNKSESSNEMGMAAARDEIIQEVRKSESARISEITAIGEKHKMRELAAECVRSGGSIEDFRSLVLDRLSNGSPIKTTTEANTESNAIGMSDKEARDFSIIKATRASITGSWKGAELEKEASDAVAKKMGREPSSFFVPLDVMHGRSDSGLNKRNLEKLTNTAGGYLVDTDYMASSFIEMLRNKMLVNQMGARVMSGLHGDVAIPKQTGGAKPFWVSEGMSPEESQQSFGQVTLSPRTVAAYTDFTRKLILQSSPDIESLVREDLATTLALELDRVCIEGSGIGAEPPGILAHNIEEVTIVVDNDADQNALSWGKIVDLESKVAAKNADIGSLGYLCNAAMRGMLKQKEKADGTAQFIWGDGGGDGFGSLNGYRVGTTNQMPENTIIFGNFADLIIGQWGVMDVMVDPYSLGTSGGVRIRIMQDVDLAIRHVESFAVAKV